jgi:AcrR family transcriptional regulator
LKLGFLAVAAMKTSRPKRAYHHGDLKNALVDAALAHIARDGARALSLREVARSAGVSHTASYRHFPSKESLLAAIAEDGFRLLVEAMRSAVTAYADDPGAALRASGVAYVEFGVHYPDHLQVMFGNLIARTQDYPALMAASKEAYELLAAIVREGLRVGRLHGPDERSVALAAWALVHGLAVLIASGQIRAQGAQLPSPRELALAVTALLLQGIAIAPAVPAKTARTRTAGRTRSRR